MPWPLYPLFRDPVPIVQEAGWVQKIFPPLGFVPRTIQLMVCHYTDYTILAHALKGYLRYLKYLRKSSFSCVLYMGQSVRSIH